MCENKINGMYILAHEITLYHYQGQLIFLIFVLFQQIFINKQLFYNLIMNNIKQLIHHKL